MKRKQARNLHSSEVIYLKKLPPISNLGEELFLIYDRALESKSSALKKWIHHFPVRYAVTSGESLKALENFSTHIHKISKLAQNFSNRKMTFVVLGGGSLGDFGGFVASVYKRGVRLVHVPSTWLAAIDSSHGGKTALNVQGVKNQIGTFYPAAQIFLVQDILETQPAIRAYEAFSEIYKVALLQGGSFWKKFSQSGVTARELWEFLPSAVNAKYQVVQKDPLEISGHRHLLNFGHTMGHVFESLFGLPHGISVNYGLRFALDWSLEIGVMKETTWKQIEASPASGYLLSPAQDGFLKPLYARKIQQLLLSDKKKTSKKNVRFVFCEKPGHFVIREVSMAQILKEISRQSLLRTRDVRRI